MMHVDEKDPEAVAAAKEEFLLLCNLKYTKKRLAQIILFHTGTTIAFTIDATGRLSVNKMCIKEDDPIMDLVDPRWLDQQHNKELIFRFFDYLYL